MLAHIVTPFWETQFADGHEVYDHQYDVIPARKLRP